MDDETIGNYTVRGCMSVRCLVSLVAEAMLVSTACMHACVRAQDCNVSLYVCAACVKQGVAFVFYDRVSCLEGDDSLGTSAFFLEGKRSIPVSCPTRKYGDTLLRRHALVEWSRKRSYCRHGS